MSSISLSTSKRLVWAVLASAIALGTLGGYPWAGAAHASDGQPDASTPETLVQSQEAEDSDPEVSILHVSVNEADKKATLTVTVGRLSSDDVTVEYATQDGTAMAPGDYTSARGVVTIPAGTTSTAIDILIIDDLDEEDVETFTVRISNVIGGKMAVGGDIATVTVVDADPGPSLQYLFAVFAITWGGFFAYIFVMTGRRRQMQRELQALRAALDEREGAYEQGEQPK